ncbi:MAG: isoaspartyl peptidase/L-asparaginase family protein [Candidatus Thiodiazotropha sp.]|jgi:L-asparaginase / beta-aspartyl-peptidase
MANNGHYSLMIHGGAGTLQHIKDDKTAVRYLESIRCVLEHGRDVLELGGSALQAVETCASLLEDDPVFNAGCGSVLNELGEAEMDAAIMDGRNLAAGAVAAVRRIANPIQLARYVMTECDHVMLIAEGAMRFAEQCGMELHPDSYFAVPDRVEELSLARSPRLALPDRDDSPGDGDQKFGTIGAVARDPNGNLAAATSTGGIANKRQGRVGDSPIVGAGVYADNETCAVSATGYGEEIMRSQIAKTIADFMLMQGLDGPQATRAGIEYFTRKVQGHGGVIVIDRAGNCASAMTTRKMIRGWIEKGGETVVRF